MPLNVTTTQDTNSTSSNVEPLGETQRFMSPRVERRRPATGTRRPGARLPLLVGVVSLLRRHGDVILQLEKVLLADAADVHQILDFLERSVFLAVFDDARGRLGADAGQVVELAGGSSVDVDRRRERRLGRGTRRGARRRLRRTGLRRNAGGADEQRGDGNEREHSPKHGASLRASLSRANTTR